MKHLLMLSAMFLAFQAQAEIYKCKDGDGKISYQGTPCVNGMIGKLKKLLKYRKRSEFAPEPIWII